MNQVPAHAFLDYECEEEEFVGGNGEGNSIVVNESEDESADEEVSGAMSVG